MQERRDERGRHRTAVAVAVLVLFVVSLTAMRRAGDSDGWQEWTWLFVGVSTGVLAVNTLVDRIRLAWRTAGRHGSRGT